MYHVLRIFVIVRLVVRPVGRAARVLAFDRCNAWVHLEIGLNNIFDDFMGFEGLEVALYPFCIAAKERLEVEETCRWPPSTPYQTHHILEIHAQALEFPVTATPFDLVTLSGVLFFAFFNCTSIRFVSIVHLRCISTPITQPLT